METRSVTMADALTLARLHGASFEPEGRWSLPQILDSLALPTTHGWGVIKEHELAGFILCQLAGDEAEILTLCTSPQHRQQGIGKTLLHAACSGLRTQGAARLLLDVAADNAAAIALYEKTGFAPTGTRKAYYKRAFGSVDARLYSLSLAKN